MKAVVYDAPKSFTIRDIPTPDPKPGEVRVRVRQTGICGTDLHIHNGKFFAEFPLTPGHELIGPVDALGEGTEGFRVGEYVAVNPNMNCGRCAYCRAGRTLLCANLKGLGTNWPGSFAEYVVVPANLVFSVDGIDPDVSVFTEPTACAMHGVETLSPRPGSSALVFGAGPTGLLLSQLIARSGAVSVTVAASSAFKLKRAEELGIDSTFVMNRTDLAGDVGKLMAASGGGFGAVRAADAERRDRDVLRRDRARGPGQGQPLRRVPARDHDQGLVRGDRLVPGRDRGAADRAGQDRRADHAPVHARPVRRGPGGAARRPDGAQDHHRVLARMSWPG